MVQWMRIPSLTASSARAYTHARRYTQTRTLAHAFEGHKAKMHAKVEHVLTLRGEGSFRAQSAPPFRFEKQSHITHLELANTTRLLSTLLPVKSFFSISSFVNNNTTFDYFCLLLGLLLMLIYCYKKKMIS